MNRLTTFSLLLPCIFLSSCSDDDSNKEAAAPPPPPKEEQAAQVTPPPPTPPVVEEPVVVTEEKEPEPTPPAAESSPLAKLADDYCSHIITIGSICQQYYDGALTAQAAIAQLDTLAFQQCTLLQQIDEAQRQGASNPVYAEELQAAQSNAFNKRQREYDTAIAQHALVLIQNKRVFDAATAAATLKSDK